MRFLFSCVALHLLTQYLASAKNIFIRQRFLAKALLTCAFSLASPHLIVASGAIIHPSKLELKEVFTFISDEEDSFGLEDFQRLDESPDTEFYIEPKLVEHIDSNAVKALIRYHGSELNVVSQRLYGKLKPLDILDVCSSWVSHLPTEYDEKSSQVVGVGMNELELKQNKQLSSYFVRDLNVNQAPLPFGDNSFDVVLIQLSIDYLTHPVEVLKEISRVLRPQGEILVSFSNRVFLNKAIGLWTGKSDIDHIETVGTFLRLTKTLGELEALDISPSLSSGDPLYVVKAVNQKYV